MRANLLVDSEAQGPVPKGTGPFFASFVRCTGKRSTQSASKNDDRCKALLMVRPEGLEPPTPRSVDLPSVLETESEQE